MKIFYLFILCSSSVYAQDAYFNETNKKQGLEFYKEKIYQGCLELKQKQDSISSHEMKKMAESTLKIVEQNFSSAFDENPKIYKAFKIELEKLANDPACQNIGNHCRAKVLSYSLYYYQKLRPDIVECQGVQCEMELKYRKNNLQNVSSAYGLLGPGSYKKELISAKNTTTKKLFNLIMQKDKVNLHICNDAKNGKNYQYDLDVNDPGNYSINLDPDLHPVIPKECAEEKTSLLSEFIPTSFDAGRSTVGRDQIEPVKVRILEFIKAHTNVILSDITITASSSKAPYYTTIAGKKVLDPKSDAKNLSLANERSAFAQTVLNEIKSSSSQFSHVNFRTEAQLAGPDFSPLDLNDRFVTNMTPDYSERLEALYTKYKKNYEEQALKTGAQDLADSNQFVNLYQAKYKPFQGFRIQIKGYDKSQMKCLSVINNNKDQTDSRATKQ